METYGNPICCSVAGELVCVVSRQIGGCKAKPYGTIPRLLTVLGELLVGVFMGPSLLGLVHPTETLTLLEEIGVMLLLFEVGLESDLQSFLRVGPSAAVVALIGVAVPFALGYGVAAMLHVTTLQAIFVGATLTATSVAISARVLSDLGRLQSREGNIILGAAVLDDILGLVILSVMVGLAESGTISWLAIAQTAGLAILFLSVAILFGNRYATLFSKLVNRLNTRGALVITALTFALLLGYVAEEVRVAPFVGAFAAGLILARTEHQRLIEERLKPITDVFVPIFFVLVGVAVNLNHLNPFNPQNRSILLLAGGVDARRHHRQACLRLGRAGSNGQSLGGGDRHGASRRSGVDFCGCGTGGAYHYGGAIRRYSDRGRGHDVSLPCVFEAPVA
jgi:Kef-type K+ transport system membrane component KefB